MKWYIRFNNSRHFSDWICLIDLASMISWRVLFISNTLIYFDFNFVALQIDPTQCNDTSSLIEVSERVVLSSDSLAETNCNYATLHFLHADHHEGLVFAMIDLNYNGTTANNNSDCDKYLAIGSDIYHLSDICGGRERQVVIWHSLESFVTVKFNIHDPTKQRFILYILGMLILIYQRKWIKFHNL